MCNIRLVSTIFVYIVKYTIFVKNICSNFVAIVLYSIIVGIYVCIVLFYIQINKLLNLY